MFADVRSGGRSVAGRHVMSAGVRGRISAAREGGARVILKSWQSLHDFPAKTLPYRQRARSRCITVSCGHDRGRPKGLDVYPRMMEVAGPASSTRRSARDVGVFGSLIAEGSASLHRRSFLGFYRMNVPVGTRTMADQRRARDMTIEAVHLPGGDCAPGTRSPKRAEDSRRTNCQVRCGSERSPGCRSKKAKTSSTTV